jgi:predicted PurR-regulated permease PerM
MQTSSTLDAPLPATAVTVDPVDEATVPVPGAAEVLRRGSRLFRRRVTTLAHLAFVVFGTAVFAYVARPVLIPILLAWVISMMLKPPTRWLRRCYLPPSAAAAIVVACAIIAIGYGAMHLVRPASEWLERAPENIPKLKQKFAHILAPAARLTAAAADVGSLDAAAAATKIVQPVEVKDNRMASTMFTWTWSLVAGIGETVALVFLLLAWGERFVQRLVPMLPTLRDKKQIVEISRELENHISQYLFSVGMINFGFGAAVGGALYLAGLPNAMMWGAAAALANFVPYFGPVLGVAAVAVSGLIEFDSLGAALLPGACYFGLHLIETNVITPLVLGRRFTLNPVVIFVAVIFGIWLWGVIGALLAVPLLVVLKVVCERVQMLSSFGEFLSG